MIYALDRLQQRCVEQITLKTRFRVLEVFKVSSRDTLLLLHPSTRLVLRMRLLQGFSALFTKLKSAGLVAADSSPSTRRAYGVPMAVEEDESEPVTESELENE